MLLNRATNKLSVCNLSPNNKTEKYSENMYGPVVFKNLYLKQKDFTKNLLIMENLGYL